MASLSAANVLAYVIQVSLITSATAVCMALIRLRNPETRYWSWRALLWLAVALPLLQPWDAATVIVAPVGDMAGGALSQVTSRVATFSPQGGMTGWNPVLVIVGGTMLRLLWLAAGAVRLRRIAGRSASDRSDAASLQELMVTDADVRYSNDLAQPATCGVLRPVVLLPNSLRALPESTRRAVLAHELVHVKRRDWTALMTEELLRAALWFNPAVWWLIDRVHAAREEVVDAEAVLYVDSRRSYINALLAFADAPAVAAAPAFAHRRHLFSRIKRLCEESTMSSRRFLVTTCLLTLAITTSTVYAVSAFPIQAGENVLLAPSAPLPPAVGTQDPPPPPPAPAPAPSRPPRDPRVAPPPPPPAPQDPPPPPPAIKVAADADALRIGGNIKAPAKIKHVSPVYPPEARAAGVKGLVILEVLIDRDGHVIDSVILKSIPMLDEAATDAVRQWTFTPTLLNGAPVQVIMTVTVNFTLE